MVCQLKEDLAEAERVSEDALAFAVKEREEADQVSQQNFTTFACEDMRPYGSDNFL